MEPKTDLKKSDSETFTRKYAPTKSSEVLGQEEQIGQLDDFIKNFKKYKAKGRRSIIIHGPPGCGKTCSVYCLAKENNLELIELNASDFRNKEQIESIIGSAIKQQSLFYKGKVILVDEVDGVSGTKDRGGVSALTQLIENSSFPVICTAIDPYSQNMKLLRKKSTLLQFNEVDYTQIAALLKKICEKEGIKSDSFALNSLARMAGGDIRAALNDLQSIASEKKELTKESLDSVGERKKIESIPSALVRVFKSSDPLIAISAFENVEDDPDGLMLWVDENLPLEYTEPADLARAYDYISKADIMKNRIKRWQHWRFLVYLNAYMTAGVAVSKDKKNPNFIAYKPTTRILKIWQANMKNEKRKALAEKIAEKTHTSTKRVIKDVLPFIKPIFSLTSGAAKKMTEELASEFEFDSDEIEWLKKQK